MKKITIINAYGDKNIGDAAILKKAIELVNEAYGENCQISVLCEDTKSFSEFITDSKNITPFQLPYGYAIRGKEKASTFKKIRRFLDIYISSLNYVMINKFLNVSLPIRFFYSYIKEIAEADVVISMGGGYLTTNTRSDYFGLLLTLLPVYISKIYRKRIIFLPMSFGPFSNRHHETLSYNAIKNTTVFARDKITFNILEKLDTDHKVDRHFAPDLALLLNKIKDIKADKSKSNYIVVTAREWFKDIEKQTAYENSLVKLIEYSWEKYQLKTVFIPMARNKIEDDDNRAAKRIIKHLKIKNIFSVFEPKSVEDVRRVLSKARLAVCTRMHSAILAATVGTPFIAIGYGHKTLGFVKNYGIEKWHIDISEINFDKASKLLINLLKKDNYSAFQKLLEIQEKRNYTYVSKISHQLVIYDR